MYFAKIIDKADIKPYNEDIVFSILWEDTYVCISYLNKGEAIAEFIGFLNKEILITNKIQLDTCRNYYSGYNLKETECK